MEATRLWADDFNIGSQNSLYVKIPNEWSNIFTVMLMSLDNFTWVKEVLSSKVMLHFKGKSGHIDFFLPLSCPSDDGVPCFSVPQLDIGLERSTLSLEKI